MNKRFSQRGPTSIDTHVNDVESTATKMSIADRLGSSVGKAKSEPAVQRKVLTDEKEETLQRKGKGEAGTVSSGFQSAVHNAKGHGNKMDQQTSGFMSARFGKSFDGVNIHNNSRAHKMAMDINARAFTVGQDIFFNKGEYQPGTHAGRKLLAHELTHTIQQESDGNSLQKEEPAHPPKKSAQDIIDEHTSMYDLKEYTLGRTLYELARDSSAHYQLVLDVFNLLNASNKKEVSDGMIEQLGDTAIKDFTTTRDGVAFLKAISSLMTPNGAQQKRLIKLIPSEQEFTEAERQRAVEKLKEKGGTAEVNFYPDYKGMDYAEKDLKAIGRARADVGDVVSFGVEEFDEIELYLEIISEQNGDIKNFIRELHFLGHGRGGDHASFGFGRYMTGLEIIKSKKTGAFAPFIADGGSVLMEGCAVAAGVHGKEYLKEIARITFGNDKTGYIKGNQCGVVTSGEITECNPITMRWPSDF